MSLQVPAWLSANLIKKSNVIIPEWIFQDLNGVAKELHLLSDEDGFNEEINEAIADILAASVKLQKLI